MDSRSIQFVADGCEAALVAGDVNAFVRRVITDSRQAGPGDLFIALPGEKFDGHAFVAAAVERGVTGVVVERQALAKLRGSFGSAAVLSVDHTRQALGRLASRYRAEFRLPIVAVGGSNGKTTTKELLAFVLRQRFRTLWSEASFNNDVGVPLTLLRLEALHQAAVLEAGTNHAGELAPLLEQIRPLFGVITSIGREHLEFFGDLEGVVREEGAMGEHLPPDGRLFIPGDSPWAGPLAVRAKCPVIRVGLGLGNDWRGRNVRVGEAGVEFEAEAPGGRGSGEYRVRLLGHHQVTNALLALAVGTELGLDPEQLRRGLEDCPSPKMRLQLSVVNGIRLLDDTYNANADSVVAALETLMALPSPGRRIAVLGDMAELGAQTAPAHAEIGRASAELRVDCLVAVGRWADITASAAAAAGLEHVVKFADVTEASRALPTLVASGDTVLVKASRATGLDRVLDAIRHLSTPSPREGAVGAGA